MEVYGKGEIENKFTSVRHAYTAWENAVRKCAGMKSDDELAGDAMSDLKKKAGNLESAAKNLETVARQMK